MQPVCFLDFLWACFTCWVSCRASSDPDAADQVDWDNHFVVGSMVNASVHEQKDYGLVFDFAAHADVLGLAAKHQVRVILNYALLVLQHSLTN